MPLTDQLVSFWKLGEASGNSRADSVGSNALLETGGTVASTTGKIGNAASFNEGNYLSINDNASLSLTGDLTVCAWVNINPAISLDFPAIASKWASGQRSYSLRYDRTTSRFNFSASADGAVTINSVANTFGAPSTSVWYFILGYVDLAGDVIGISVNNGIVDTTAYTGSGVFDGTAAFEIGHFGTSGNTFNGEIDAVGIWSRKLTATEITALYNDGNGQEPPFIEGGVIIPYFGSGHSPYRVIRRVTAY